MAISASLALLLLAPQLPTDATAHAERDRPARAVLIGGFATQHDATFAELGLGDGGFRGPERTARHDPGAWTSPGGALIQVAEAGIRITYPGGGELMFTPTGFFHLRDGSQAGPFERGFELVFADRSTLRVERSQFGRHPLGEVSVSIGRTLHRLWQRGELDREARRWRDYSGTRLMALGDGTALFAAASRGPVLVLERQLCAEDQRERLPETQIVLHGDPLRESLARLSFRYASPRGDFPQLDQLARGLTNAATAIFPPGHHELSVSGTQPLRIQLGNFELAVGAVGTAPMRLGLRADPASEFPLVEWTLSRRHKLEVLRPNAVDKPGRRYYDRGLEVMRADRFPLSARDSTQDALWMAEALERLGQPGAR